MVEQGLSRERAINIAFNALLLSTKQAYPEATPKQGADVAVGVLEALGVSGVDVGFALKMFEEAVTW